MSAQALGWAPVEYREWCATLMGIEVLRFRAVVYTFPHALAAQELLSTRELDRAVNRERLIQYTREKLFARLERGI